jgi:hypothetical protein
VDSRLVSLGIGRSERSGRALEDLLLKGNIVGSICTVLVQRELLQQVGGFDPQLSQCADWDMWVRLARETEFLYLDEPLVTYRQHDQNMSQNVRLLEHDSVRLLHKAMEHPTTPLALRRKRARIFGRNWMVLAGSYFKAGQYQDFLRCAVLAIQRDPSQAARLLGYPIRRIQSTVRPTAPELS